MLEVKILRQDAPEKNPYWARFSVDIGPRATVIDALKAIQRNPIEVEGRAVAPVVWACNCLEEVCGACAMLVNAAPMLACSAIIEEHAPNGAIELRPLSRFPVLRDLMVDRSALLTTYRKYRLYPGRGKTGYRTKWPILYPYTRCTACGICVEACPNTLTPDKTKFDGMAHMARLRLLTEFDAMDARLFTAMEKSGVARCSGHGLCAEYCPKKIDLLGAIGRVNRATNARMFRFKPRKKVTEK